MDERLKMLRRALGLTQVEFANRIGSKRATIAKYETSTNAPSAAVISLICREFNVSEQWLREGIGEMFTPVPTDTLDALVREYGLGAFGRAVIERLVNLDKQQWAAAYKFAVGVLDDLQKIPAPDVPVSAPAWSSSAPGPVEEEEAPSAAPSQSVQLGREQYLSLMNKNPEDMTDLEYDIFMREARRLAIEQKKKAQQTSSSNDFESGGKRFA